MVRYKQRKRLKKNVKHFPFLLVALFFVAAIVFLPLQISTCFKYSSSFNLAIADQNGDIEVVNFDNKNQEITTIVIPGSTQLTVSRQLGSWKARGLWQLGINENYSGNLMQETIIRNFFLPVNAWSDKEALGFVQGNFWKAVGAVVSPYRSSLKLGDKIKLALLSLRVSDSKKDTINLKDTGLLKPAKLTDGENGYLIGGDIPPKIASVFADDLFSQKEVRILIKNYSSSGVVADNVGKVIEVLGAKVSSIVKEDNSEIDCKVIGNNRTLVIVIGTLFNCEKKVGVPEGKFDIEIDLGEQFVRRY